MPFRYIKWIIRSRSKGRFCHSGTVRALLLGTVRGLLLGTVRGLSQAGIGEGSVIQEQ